MLQTIKLWNERFLPDMLLNKCVLTACDINLKCIFSFTASWLLQTQICLDWFFCFLDLVIEFLRGEWDLGHALKFLNLSQLWLRSLKTLIPSLITHLTLPLAPRPSCKLSGELITGIQLTNIVEINVFTHSYFQTCCVKSDVNESKGHCFSLVL